MVGEVVDRLVLALFGVVLTVACLGMASEADQWTAGILGAIAGVLFGGAFLALAALVVRPPARN